MRKKRLNPFRMTKNKTYGTYFLSQKQIAEDKWHRDVANSRFNRGETKERPTISVECSCGCGTITVMKEY